MKFDFNINLSFLITLAFSVGALVWSLSMKLNHVKHLQEESIEAKKERDEIKNDIKEENENIKKDINKVGQKIDETNNMLSNRLTAIETGCRLRHKNGTR